MPAMIAARDGADPVGSSTVTSIMPTGRRASEELRVDSGMKTKALS